MNFLKKIFFSSGLQQPNQMNQIKTQQSDEQIPFDVLTQLFERSAKYVVETSTPISDQNKLALYGLYKQATIGDCNTPKPSMLDFVGKTKWNAWNSYSGLSKPQAIKMYISKAVEFVPEIQKKMENFIQGNQAQNNYQSAKKTNSTVAQSTAGLKMVEQKDYSDSYSHPYFRLIQKNFPIEKQILTHELLIEKNNNPKCYPLHFAIDKERVDLVRQFLELLTVQEINSMQDENGTGIQEYSQLIENEQIIQLVEEKLKSS